MYTQFEIVRLVRRNTRILRLKILGVIKSYSICTRLDSRSNQESLIALKLVDVDLFNFWANNLLAGSIAPCRPELYIDSNETTPTMHADFVTTTNTF